jgi:hypothetical protein
METEQDKLLNCLRNLTSAAAVKLRGEEYAEGIAQWAEYSGEWATTWDAAVDKVAAMAVAMWVKTRKEMDAKGGV